MLVRKMIFTAEPPRTPRIHFLFGREIPPNKKAVLAEQMAVLGSLAIGNSSDLFPQG